MIPIHQGRRVRYGKDGEQIVENFEGYYLTIDEIIKLCRNYKTESNYGFVNYMQAWIEQKLKEL